MEIYISSLTTKRKVSRSSFPRRLFIKPGMYDGADYEDAYGTGRMDCTLDESLDLVPSDHWDEDPRSPSPDALEREICSNFTCCGLAIPDMHDLLAHFEYSHVFVLSKQHSASDAQPSSVLASQTSPSPYSHQNDDEYDPEPFVLSYPQPRALPSPSPIPSLSSATQTFPGLGVCIPSGSRPSTPELSAAGSDSDPVSSSPASVFTPLSPFMPFSSAFSATSVSMESRMDEPAYSTYPRPHSPTPSIYARPFEVGSQQPQALEPNLSTSHSYSHPHPPPSPPIRSLPPASFSLPASTSARTRPTPAARAKKSTTKKAGSGATSNRVHDLGRRIKERRGVVDVGGAGLGGACADAGTGSGSVSVVSRAGVRNGAGASKGNEGLSGSGRKTKRGARGKFVSNTTKTTERLVTGLGSGLRSGSSFSPGSALEVGRGCDGRVSEDASPLVDHNPLAMADASSQASYPSIERHERAEDLTAGVRVGTGVASTSGRKSREKAFRCPTRGCAKSYLNPNGLKYHLEKGTCTVPRPRSSFPAPDSPSTTAPNSFFTTAMDSNGIPAVATHIAQCPRT